MRNLPVHWYEGVFLRPQHLQAADRHWNELIQTSDQWDHAYNYGLRVLEISPDALKNFQFQVHRLQARLRDGTLVSLEAGSEPDRLPLKGPLGQAPGVNLEDAFATEATLDVYLAVPKLQLGRPNVGHLGDVERPRYVSQDAPIQDESFGGNDQTVQFRSLNARLMLSTDDLTGYETLPIARVRRASEEQALPRIDSTYIPPLLAVEAWPGLGREIVRAIYDMIGQKIEVLSNQIANRGIGLESRDPGDLDRVLMLGQLNQAYAVLAVMAFAQGEHPLTVYTELCRIVGQLSIFGPMRRVEDIPGYDHDDLARIFTYIKLKIEQLINAVRDYEFQQRHFVGVGLGLQVTLEPKWFNSDWQWYIGVHKGDLSEIEVRELLSPGQLDWKFGSARQVEVLFKHRAAGLNMAPLDRQVRALPSKQEWVYYEVARRDSPAWKDVQETQTLAVRLKDSLIQNLDRLQGERKLIVSFRGRRVELQFALFAVPLQA